MHYKSDKLSLVKINFIDKTKKNSGGNTLDMLLFIKS